MREYIAQHRPAVRAHGARHNKAAALVRLTAQSIALLRKAQRAPVQGELFIRQADRARVAAAAVAVVYVKVHGAAQPARCKVQHLIQQL